MKQTSIWTSSIQNLRSTKMLALLAIFIAMKVALAPLFIPVGENLRITFRFLPIALEALIFGPVPAMLSGVITDLVGFILFPSGPFFPGYAISAVCLSLIYSLGLYQKQVTVLRIGVCKACCNYLVNVLLGSLWSMILYSKAYLFYVVSSLIKNSILLPFEILALVLLLNILLPILQKKSLVKIQDSHPMKLF